MLYNVLPKPITKIFIDLDDVLVDFAGSAFDLFNPTSMRTSTSMKKFWESIEDKNVNAIMWKKIMAKGPEWWAHLPKLPWADELLKSAKKACGDVVILTSPGHSAGSGMAAQGKIAWSLKEFGSNEVIVAYKKYMCSSPGALLIDDWDKFIVPWEERGGSAVKLKRDWSKGGYTPEKIIEALNMYTSKWGMKK